MSTPQPDLPFTMEGGFDGLYRLTIVEREDGLMRGEVPVTPSLHQPFGLVHGGVYASIAETLASMGTWFGVRDDGMVAMGLSNNTSFLRPITTGTIHALAQARHRGRTTWVWDVEATDDDGHTCALTRMTIAVRPRPEGR